ncbi:co-chaperone YbbN [Breoghania sp.]|uniref:co-chaperone YbbN n=1 Tax=Breoghania sp. TaxID=2065378 RepID=UPI0029CA9D3D|nr:co-chaperone YbbN [Breoghania sp.]
MSEPTFTFGDTGGANLGGAAANGASDVIKDTTTQTFMADVIEASQQVPVLVELWAPWCGPCKQLGPALEKVVTNARGAVKMVKLNIDENPEIPGQMGIQSVPTVVAFVGGRPVDAFSGALPESQIQKFVEKLAGPVGPSEAELMLEQAQTMLAADDIANAAQFFAGVLGREPENAAAIAGIVQCQIKAGDLDRARQILESVPAEKADDPAIAAARAALELAAQAEETGDLSELEAAVAADPGNFQARFDLAVALGAKGRKNEAVDSLIEIVRSDRSWNDEAARKQLLQFFEAWGFKDPASAYGRRKLSAVLFS